MPTESWAHKRLVFNLIKRRGDCAECFVCGKPVQADDSEDIRVIIVDSTKPRIITNLALRHRLCERSKYRPAINPQDMVRLVETMISSKHKLCAICGRSYANVEEFEHLTLVEHNSVVDVAHLTCMPRRV